MGTATDGDIAPPNPCANTNKSTRKNRNEEKVSLLPPTHNVFFLIHAARHMRKRALCELKEQVLTRAKGETRVSARTAMEKQSAV